MRIAGRGVAYYFSFFVFSLANVVWCSQKRKFYAQNVQLSAQWHLLSGENMVQVKFITRALALNE